MFQRLIPIFRNKDDSCVGVLFNAALKDTSPETFKAKSLFLEDGVHWLGALRCLCSSDSGVDVVDLGTISTCSMKRVGRTCMWDDIFQSRTVAFSDIDDSLAYYHPVGKVGGDPEPIRRAL